MYPEQLNKLESVLHTKPCTLYNCRIWNADRYDPMPPAPIIAYPRMIHAPWPVCESPYESAKLPNAASANPMIAVTRGPKKSRKTPKNAFAALRHRKLVEKTYC